MAEPVTRLPRDELHLWRGSLDQPGHMVDGCEAVLSDDERRRAAAFTFERDQRRFVVGRSILRTLLGGYTGDPPEEVRFRYGLFGKPVLDGPGPWFNVSHSGPVALFAFSSSLEVGIDIEYGGAPPDRDQIADRFFSPAERSQLRSLPVDQRAAAFLACWTRKEAFLKARGDGLSLALDSFDVSVTPGGNSALLATTWSADEAREWRLVDVSDPAAGYVAAIAARGAGWQVVPRRFDTNFFHYYVPAI